MTTRLALPGGQAVFHYRARFDNLEPGSAYAFRVGDGTVWSEWNRLRTASAGPERFRFIFLGDAQNSVESHCSRVARAAYAHAPDARFILAAGDLTNGGWDDALWAEWCRGLGFISATVPVLASPGNHDIHEPPGGPRGKLVSQVQPAWRAHLTVPENGPAGEMMLNGACWSLDYQGVRIASIDANPYAEEDFDSEVKARLKDVQPRWLDEVMRAPANWRIVLQHEPYYPVAKERDYPELRAAFMPVIERHGIDLVLQGHDHRYARSHKLSRGRVAAPPEDGTIYALSISGPKLNPEQTRFVPLIAIREGESQMFQIITVAADRLRYQAYTVTGELVDDFELVRLSTGGSSYVNLAP